MATLSTNGKKLFLAELAAHSLIKELEIGWAISSILNARHKVREADIHVLLDNCRKLPGESYQRLLAVVHLVVFACAAYSDDDLDYLYTCARDKLKTRKVHPHFGGEVQLQHACDSEPMNLWLGSARENQQGNQQTLDVHRVSTYIIGGETIETAQPFATGTTGRTGTTDGERYLANLTSNPRTVMQPNAFSTPERKTFARIGNQQAVTVVTPMSSSLSSNIAAIKKNFTADRLSYDGVKLVGSATLMSLVEEANVSNIDAVNLKLHKHYKALDQQLLEAKELVDSTSKAGADHYKNLLRQLEWRGVEITDEYYQRISTAKDAWELNRAALKKLLETHTTKLKGQTYALIASQGSVSIPSNFFLLRP